MEKIKSTDKKETIIRKENILKNGKNYFGKIFNNNKETREIKIIIWIIMNLFLILVILVNKINIIKKQKRNVIKTKTNQKKYDKNDFNEILPKISLTKKTAPSFEEIFNSRTLFLSLANLSGEYLRYIRPINEDEEQNFKKKYSENETTISPEIFKKRENQYNFKDFAKLCLEEKLIDSKKIEYNNNPFISLILPSYNKANILLKSIRSIQNQSFKNIEIIIVDDCSNDDSKKVFEYLLETDPRIRIFSHLKNMGVWRSRLDGILYSKGKYILLFDTGDIYEDNYVLEDAYNIIEKYNLDSLKMTFRIVTSYDRLNESMLIFHVDNNSIIYESSNIEKYNNYVFKGWGNIWTRITKANIFIKGLYLLNDIILNAYKNFWDDIWYNTIINKVSYSFLVIERIAYIYLQNGTGEGSPKFKTDIQKNKIIKEFLWFLYFDYNILPVNDKKTQIINKLKQYNKRTGSIKLSFLKSEFFILTNLINILIKDPYVSNKDKNYLNKLLNFYKNHRKILKINQQ